MKTSLVVPLPILPHTARHRRRALALSALTAALLGALPPASAQAPAAYFSDGVYLYARHRILLESAAGLSDDDLAALLREHGGRARRLGQSNLRAVDLPAAASEAAVVARLRGHPFLRFVELDRLVPAALAVNDPNIGSEWHIPLIGAPAAWDRTQGAGVTIAILDSGVDPNHPDLKGNLVPGYNFYNNDTNTADVCGHGTAVAGAAAARTNNGLGVAGVAGQARIMPLRIGYLDVFGRCFGSLSAMVDAITYAADNGARIANISYGPLMNSDALLSGAQYMKSKGGLVFISAGNNAVDEHWVPSTSVIAVSATNSTDALASFSSFGDFVSLPRQATRS